MRYIKEYESENRQHNTIIAIFPKILLSATCPEMPEIHKITDYGYIKPILNIT